MSASGARSANSDHRQNGVSAASMTIRTSSKSVTFAHPFWLKGVDRILGAGDHRVVTDEELIEELSFPVYRRVATMIFVPAGSQNASSVEMVTIDPRDLREAQDRDATTKPTSTTTQPEMTRQKD
jgi:hypothetical protein